jgi:hypothetical protein
MTKETAMKYQFYRDFLETAFATHKPRYGDIISVNRGLYKHYGIYKNEQSVINFAPKNGFELNPKEAIF